MTYYELFIKITVSSPQITRSCCLSRSPPVRDLHQVFDIAAEGRHRDCFTAPLCSAVRLKHCVAHSLQTHRSCTFVTLYLTLLILHSTERFSLTGVNVCSCHQGVKCRRITLILFCIHVLLLLFCDPFTSDLPRDSHLLWD